MNSLDLNRSVFSRIVCGLLLATLIGLTGCATNGDNDSDMPWTTPEPWEGSPYIPGFNTQ